MCLCNTTGIKHGRKHPDNIRMSLDQPERRWRTAALGRVGWGDSTDSEHGRSVRKKLSDKVCYSRQAPLNLFERPLRHLRAGSSIARSGPVLNPLPAAWNGWRQIPVLRPPLSKRNGGREGQGEMEG